MRFLLRSSPVCLRRQALTQPRSGREEHEQDNHSAGTSMTVILGSEKFCEAGTRAAPTLRAAVPSPSTPLVFTCEPPSRYPAAQSPVI